jgi:hypothetical protein
VSEKWNYYDSINLANNTAHALGTMYIGTIDEHVCLCNIEIKNEVILILKTGLKDK